MATEREGRGGDDGGLRRRSRSRSRSRGREREYREERASDRQGDARAETTYAPNNGDEAEEGKTGALMQSADAEYGDELARFAIEGAETKEEEEEERLREERKRRRQAILARHKEADGQGEANGNEDLGEDEHKVGEYIRLEKTGEEDEQREGTAASYEEGNEEGILGREEETDMFAETPTGEMGNARAREVAKKEGKGLQDNWDDVEGYYRAQQGEVIPCGQREYEVTSAMPLGRGVFSTVVRAKRRGDDREAALKIVRNNETMAKAAQLEITILRKVAETDQGDKKHCIRLLDTFEYRQHIIMAFEAMDMNLREVLRKYGRNVGIHTEGVQVYAKQMGLALKHMRNNGVLHADLKPDNMLVNESRTVLKVCDFGSAMFDGNNEVTPYLVSRFYRAPEIILGLQYSTPIDTWSVACCLYELATGDILFKGRSNNEMLKLMMDVKGPFPKRMLRKGLFAPEHFLPDGTFQFLKDDPATNQPFRKQCYITKPSKSLSGFLGAHRSASSEITRRRLARLADLLDKAFNLDPEKRLTSHEVCSPFYMPLIP